MRKHGPINNAWILIAVCTGMGLFFIVAILSEFRTTPNTNIRSVVPTRFNAVNTRDFSTALRTRDELLGVDQACLNQLMLTNESTMRWDGVRDFFLSLNTVNVDATELTLRESLSATPDATIISLCALHDTIYALRMLGEGDTVSSYDIFVIYAPNDARAVAQFLIPKNRIITMRTDLFKQSNLSISAVETTDASMQWYYFKFEPSQESFAQIEACTRWYVGDSSPFDGEDALECDYIYKF